MFGRTFASLQQQQFAEQFEPHETGFLYRRSMRGAPVRVSAAERDSFIETFDRRVRILNRSLTAAVLVLIAGLVAFAMTYEVELQDSWIYAGTGLILAGFMIAWFRIWNAPAIELQRRMPVGSAQSRAEVRRRMLSKISWGEMAGFFAALALVVAINVPDDWQAMDVGDWVLVLAAAFALLALAFAAIIKLSLRE